MEQLNVIDRLRRMGKNEQFLKDLGGTQGTEEIIEVCSRYGLNLTNAEAEELCREADAYCDGRELDEDALDEVAGGMSFLSAGKKAVNLVCFIFGYVWGTFQNAKKRKGK